MGKQAFCSKRVIVLLKDCLQYNVFYTDSNTHEKVQSGVFASTFHCEKINVTGRPANRAGARSTLKTVDRRKMTAEEEKIALVAAVAVKEE